jgi:hypothetical protein
MIGVKWNTSRPCSRSGLQRVKGRDEKKRARSALFFSSLILTSRDPALERSREALPLLKAGSQGRDPALEQGREALYVG